MSEVEIPAGRCGSEPNASGEAGLVGRLSVRPIRADELEQVLEVYRQCEDFLALGPQAKATMEMVLSDLRASQAEGGIYCGIYEPRGPGEWTMIGVLDFVPGGFKGKAEHACLNLLMIAAPDRSRGVGRRIVRWLEGEIARRSGARAIFSGVQVNNPGAIRFWQRMGFEIIRGPEQMPDTTAVYSLVKSLRREAGPGEEGGRPGD